MSDYMTRRFTSFGSVVTAAVLMTTIIGCATTAPPPTSQMAEARSAVKQAEDVGGMEYAALEYRRAQQKLEDAQAALLDKKHDRARRLAEQAAVDAELASVKARTAKANAAVNELRESIKVLREEMAKTGT